MSNTLALEKLNTARQAIAEVRTIPDAKQLLDAFTALTDYAKRQRLELEVQNEVAECRIWTRRKLGEMLEVMPKAEGGRPTKTPSGLEGVNDVPTLDDLGITYAESSRLQTEASVPAETVAEYIATCKEESKEITSAGVGRLAQKQSRQAKRKELEAVEWPEGKYRVWYADPPWQYSDSGVITDTDSYGRAERHYPTMSIPELCSMGSGIQAQCTDNAVLFLWVTSPMLEVSFRIIKAWGFQYKTSFVWDKVRHNFGHYNSVRHEFLLVCTRGSCLPDVQKLFDSVQSIERSDTHSEKPQEFRDIIDTLYLSPNKGIDRVELFARGELPPHWEGWGNESTRQHKTG